jgi:hypothetical protein
MLFVLSSSMNQRANVKEEVPVEEKTCVRISIPSIVVKAFIQSVNRGFSTHPCTSLSKHT